MSSSNQETIADIVSEMRQAEATWHRSEIAQLPTQYLNEWSDRIEAAEKREREATREKSSQVGNAAKIREALSRILGIADHLQTRFTIPKLAYEEISELKQIAESALAAPPRNCDMYNTLDDARNAFFADYVPDETCSSATAFAIWTFDKVKGEAK